jgi:stage IV sporulation protein FB
MKHILGWGDWYIHPFTLLYIFVAYLSDNISAYLIALGVVCFHEMFHYVFAKRYHFKIIGVEILPFGAFLDLEDYGLHHVVEEMIVILAGPCSHLLLYVIIMFVGANTYALAMNQLVLVFNILPIYPLDGSKMLLLCLCFFMDYQKAIQLQIKISILSLSVLMVTQQQWGHTIIYIYLLYLNYQYIKEYRMYIVRLYTSRRQNKLYKRYKLQHGYTFYRTYQNIYQRNNKLYHETEVLEELVRSL